MVLSKKSDLDKYYTNPDIANTCKDLLFNLIGSGHSFVEPSVGAGAFAEPDWECYDIDPDCPYTGAYKEMDFLSTTEGDLKGKVVVGNPPFGFASSTALKFVNHCAKNDVNYVAMVLPKTFMKPVFQDKVDRRLHLLGECVLPKNSFILNGEPYDVPCCFQVWNLLDYEREPLKINEYIYQDEEGLYCLRRVGGRAGRLVRFSDYTPSSTYRISGDVGMVSKYQSEIDYCASLTAGVKSISLKEINHIITQGELNES